MSEAADTLKSALRLITEMIDILENSDDAEAPQAFFEAYHEANGQLNYAVYQALHPLLRAQRGQGSPSATASGLTLTAGEPHHWRRWLVSRSEANHLLSRP